MLPERGQRLLDVGSCVGLAAYPLDGNIYLVGMGYPDGAYVAHWSPTWDGREITEVVSADSDMTLIDAPDLYREWARQSARLLTVLAVMLDAHDTPVRVENDSTDRGPAGKHRARDREERRAWAYGRVDLSRPVSPTRVVSPATTGTADIADTPERDANGRLLAETSVRGHLRRQAFGTGRTERRWQWIEGHAARRWIAPAKRIKVT